MKAVFLLVVVALASVNGVRVFESAASDHKLAKLVAKSDAGKTLLMEISQKIAQGAPVEELERIIEMVTQRILDAGVADDKQYSQREANCTRDKAMYRANIAQAKQDIIATKDFINDQEIKYNELKKHIVTLQGQIDTLTVDINKIMDDIDKGRELRKAQHATFVNLTTETTSVLAAVEEIRGLEVGSTLQQAFPDADMEHVAAIREAEAARDASGALDSEGDRRAEREQDAAHSTAVAGEVANTTNVETNRFGENVGYQSSSNIYAVQLSSLAKKTKDPMTQSYLQVAATAARALSDDDVARLLALLDELKEELRQYTDELIIAEKKAARDWASTEAAYTAELRSKQSTKRDKQNELEETYRAKKDTAQRIHNARLELDGYKEVLAENEENLRLEIIKCDTYKKEWQERKARRADEIKTLEQIAAIVKNKLKTGYANTAVRTRVSGVTVGQ